MGAPSGAAAEPLPKASRRAARDAFLAEWGATLWRSRLPREPPRTMWAVGVRRAVRPAEWNVCGAPESQRHIV